MIGNEKAIHRRDTESTEMATDESEDAGMALHIRSAGSFHGFGEREEL